MEVKSFVISSHPSEYKDRDTARYAGDDKFKIPTDVRKTEENKITKIYISKRLYKKDMLEMILAIMTKMMRKNPNSKKRKGRSKMC